MLVLGFDWDSGNWPKCGKHGVSKQEIEELLLSDPMVREDPYPDELRLRAIGETMAGHYLFVVYTERKIGGILKLRPLSARYMHQKEIDFYGREKTETNAAAAE